MKKISRQLVRKVWETNDCNLPLVVSDSSWRFVNDFQDFKSCTGVFIFSTSSHQVKYVGYTKGHCIKEAIADAISENKDDGCALVKVLYTVTDNDARQIGKVLIEKYTPSNNLESAKKAKTTL